MCILYETYSAEYKTAINPEPSFVLTMLFLDGW